jgi:hypothetical protein
MDEKVKLYGETSAFPAKLGYGAGISKREYFAGLFVQAIITKDVKLIGKEVVDDAIFFADLLLEELVKSEH